MRRPARFIASRTTSSPVLLETPPSPTSRPPPRTRPVARSVVEDRTSSRQDRRIPRGGRRTVDNGCPHLASMSIRPTPLVVSRGEVRIRHLVLDLALLAHEENSSQLGGLAVWSTSGNSTTRWELCSHMCRTLDRSCECLSACHGGTCTNLLIHVYCNINCCP